MTPATSTRQFVPAGFVPKLPLSDQPGLALRWRVTNAATAVPHRSGKVAIVGHTPQPSGEILDLGFLLCLNTNRARGGRLTALEVETGQVWQGDYAGRLREDRRIVSVGRRPLAAPSGAIVMPRTPRSGSTPPSTASP